MKIFTNNAVYVQKNDIVYLNHIETSIPASIFLKIYSDEVTIIDDRNRYEFVKFENESEIEFFRKLDWIVDYNSVKDLNEEHFIELGQTIVEQRNKIAIKYNAMSNDEREKNVEMVCECERLDFKFCSLRDIFWFKQGHISFDLPDGIEYPNGYKKTKTNCLRRVLNRFKKNRKK